MLYRALIVICILSSLEPLKGQDIVNFTQFFFNPYSINPSYAGIDGKLSLTLSYRKQWATIDGGPTIVNLSIHMPSRKRLSYGLNVLKDTRGLLSNTGLLLTLGYNVPIAEHSHLRFGISAGVASNKVDWSKLDFTDVAATKIPTNTYLLGNAGVSFHSKSFHAGISFPLLLEPAYVSNDAFSITQVQPLQAFVIHMSTRFYFDADKNVFEPYLLYRVNKGLPSQYEFASVLHLNHVIYVGASYKQDFGISALGGIKANKVFALGVSYGIKSTGNNNLNSPTYEIHLGLLVGKHKKESDSYSFVDTSKEKKKKTHGKSASELLAEKHHQEELEKKKKEHELALKRNQNLEAKRKQEEQLKKRAEQHVGNVHKEEAKVVHKEELKIQKPEEHPKQVPKKDSTVVIVSHKPRFNHADATGNMNIVNTEHTQEDEQERLSRLTLHAGNPTEVHNDLNHPNAERHEFVKRGNHEKELRVADYIISGVFKEEAHAKHFSDGLVKLGFKSGYGHLTEKAVWYVYVFETNDINKARAELEQVRRMKLLRDSWLLTVQE